MSDMKSIPEFIDELWVLLFVFLKAVFVMLTTALYFVTLIVYTFTQHVFKGTQYLYKGVEAWNPVKPQIFNTERIENEEILG